MRAGQTWPVFDVFAMSRTKPVGTGGFPNGLVRQQRGIEAQ
jgi:hypothetical protein